MTDTYFMRKKHHRCTACGERDAYTMNGRALCAECCEKVNEYSKKRNAEPSNKETARIKRKQIYENRKSKGVCTRCGKRNAEARKTKCSYCLNKDKLSHRVPNALSRDIAKDIGVCYLCLKKPAMEGRCFCQDCYEKAVKSIAYARTCRDMSKRENFLFGKNLNPNFKTEET